MTSSQDAEMSKGGTPGTAGFSAVSMWSHWWVSTAKSAAELLIPGTAANFSETLA